MVPISTDTQEKIQAAFDAQEQAAEADAARKAAQDASLQAASDAEKAETLSLAAHKVALDAANEAIAALMSDLGVPPPDPGQPGRRRGI